jgi:hypothetical protein
VTLTQISGPARCVARAFSMRSRIRVERVLRRGPRLQGGLVLHEVCDTLANLGRRRIRVVVRAGKVQTDWLRAASLPRTRETTVSCCTALWLARPFVLGACGQRDRRLT